MKHSGAPAVRARGIAKRLQGYIRLGVRVLFVRINRWIPGYFQRVISERLV